MRSIVSILLALGGGFLGGFTCVLMLRVREQSHPPETSRAQSFELVDENGQMTSYWGTDKERNIVLAFGVRRDTTLPERRIGVDLKNPDYQTDVIGLMRDDTPFLRMRGADGKNRVDLLLSLYGKPFLVMSDQAGPRLRLGFEGTDTPASEDNDWSLVFLPEVARIGFRAGKMGGKTMVQGGLFIRKDKLPYP